MKNWDKLRLFTVVAERGSFSDAARHLNMSQPALSRQIRALEDELDLRLFHRHARGAVLSHDGEILFARTAEFSKAIEATRRRMSESGDGVKGQLTVTMTMTFGSQWLVPRLHRFHDAYPDVELELLLSDSDLSVGEGVAEMAVRFHSAAHADDIQRPMMSISHRLYASPDYIARHGQPVHVADLDHHRLITYGPTAAVPIKDVNWVLTIDRDDKHPRKPMLKINNVHGILRAVRAGLGIAALPEYIVSPLDDVVPVLPELIGPTFQSYIVYPSALKNAKRVKAFRDFLVDEARRYRADAEAA
ncbi:MAG: LysR family transcriptional regulator [Pseudomonadota bacterium]